MMPDDPRKGGDDPESTSKDDPPQVHTEQPADEPRGDDEIRRELGAGDGDDPPPHDDDEPLRNN